MFGLFKKKPAKLVLDYEFSSKVASVLEGFLTTCAKEWDNPSKQLQDYSLHVSHYGMISIRLNSNASNDDSLFVVPFNQISKIKTITPTVIKITLPGPFVNPLISVVADEIIDYMKARQSDVGQ